MLKILRWLFFIPQPKIQREMAITIAISHFQEQEIKVERPEVIEELKTWLVLVNKDMIGGPWVRINNQEGNVIDFGIPPR
jgi:hypothetical protein